MNDVTPWHINCLKNTLCLKYLHYCVHCCSHIDNEHLNFLTSTLIKSLFTLKSHLSPVYRSDIECENWRVLVQYPPKESTLANNYNA